MITIDKISAVIISKNVAETIKLTLDSLTAFKEVIIYDSGSTDDSLLIARKFSNVSIFQGDFLGFGPTKNHAISLATNDWIFSIDGDESLSNILIKHLSEINPDSRLIGEIRRDNYFMGKEMKVAGWGRDKIIRLFNRKEYCFSDLIVHERVEIDSLANKILLNGSISHYPVNNLSQTLEKANLYSELYSKENDNYYPIVIIILKSQFAFFRSYFIQRGFLAGWRGLVLSFANSVGVFYKYIKIYARHKKKK